MNIHCPTTGVPNPEVTWRKDGRLISLGENIAIYDNGTLSVRGATTKDSGRYTCTAQNVAGRDSVTTDVTVVGKIPIKYHHNHA